MPPCSPGCLPPCPSRSKHLLPRWLIVACDGVWDVLEDAVAAELIADLTSADDAATLLVRTARAAGGVGVLLMGACVVDGSLCC